MSNWWVVNTNTDTLIKWVNQSYKDNIGARPWEQFVQIPAEIIIPGNSALQIVNDEYSIISDNTKSSPSWDTLRYLRNQKLNACDWTQLSDSPLSTQEKEDWADYRQALRDLPQNTTDPDNPTWPTEP